MLKYVCFLQVDSVPIHRAGGFPEWFIEYENYINHILASSHSTDLIAVAHSFGIDSVMNSALPPALIAKWQSVSEAVGDGPRRRKSVNEPISPNASSYSCSYQCKQ